MDKVEYRELIRNIKNKYLQKDYEGVIEIADQLDPQKIRENSILEILAKAYESVGRSDLARNVLLVAYKRTPTGKRIAYNLAMLSIKLEDLDSAVMFYEDFCKMAPKDNQKLLLKYEIGKAGGIPVSDLARVLETYNAREMDDKWEYELARLYHEMGDGEKCAATCDQIILWYANGDYEKKALELKNMHKALTPAQQARYEEIMKEVMYYPHKEPAVDEEQTEEEPEVIEAGEIKEEQNAPETEKTAPEEEMTAEPEIEETAAEPEKETAAEPEPEEPAEEIGQSVEPAQATLPEIDYQTTHLAPQGFTEETEIEDEENIAGQLSLSAMFDAFRNQTREDREQMNKVGEDRAAQILAEVNDAHDSSILEQFTTEEDEDEPVDEIFEPEIPLLNREDMIEPVDDGGEDLGERAAEFAFEKKDADEEPKPVDGKESSVDATQFIPVDEITAQISEETIKELNDEEQIPPSVVGETSVYEEIDPGSAAGKVVVGAAVEKENEEEPASDIPVSDEPLPIEEPVQEESAQEEPAQEEPVQEELTQEEPVQEKPVQEEPAPAEPVQEKEPEKEFVLDLIFGNSEIPKRKKKVRAPEPVAEPVRERIIPAAVEETAAEAVETVEEVAAEANEAIEEASEPVEDAWDAAIDAVKAEEEAATEAVEETEEAVTEAAEEVVKTIPRGDLFVPRSRTKKSNVKNGGSGLRSVFKKEESEEDAKAREERARAEKARKAKAKAQKEKIREEKQKERSLRREMQQEERLHKEEQRVEKLREEQQRKKQLWEEQEKERLLKEQLRQEQLREEQPPEEPLLEEMLPEEPQPEEQEIPEEQVREEKRPKETTSLLQKAAGIGSLFSSLFKRKEVQRKRRVESEEETSIFDELTETALAAEEAEAAERAAAQKAAPKEDWEDAAEAAAAETIEKLREFVAKEEPGSEESDQEEELPEGEESIEEEEPEEIEESEDEEEPEEIEESEDEEEPEEIEESEEEEEPEEGEESEEEEEPAEDEEEQIPALKKPEKNPEADAAAAAALELFKQFSVKEKEDKEQKRATAKAEAEAEIEIEAEIEAKEKARAIAEELFSAGDFIEAEEEPVPEEPKPLRGNKVYRGNKNNNKKKKEKNRKRSVRIEDEIYAEIEASEKKGKKMKNTINLDELLDETLQPGKQVKKTPLNQESLDQLLNATIDFSKSEKAQPKTETKPERELTVSQSGEFDLEGFIQQDNRKEDSRQMSFDELFGGEFRPKVRIPAEASTKSQTRKLVLNKKYKLSREQRRALGEFLIVDGMEEEICSAIDNLITKKKSGDETGGHMIVTGDAKSGKTYLTIEILKAVNQEVGHGNPRVAKVQAQAINGKNIRKVLSKVTDSDLIIENIGKLEDATVRDIITAVRENDASTMVILEGNELAADTLIQNFPDLSKVFKTRVDIGELTITQWGDIAKKYAESQGYSIDGTALLALQAKIDQINTPDTKLGFDQIRRIVDDAIDKAERRGSGKLFSAFAGKADDSLIALTEESFM